MSQEQLDTPPFNICANCLPKQDPDHEVVLLKDSSSSSRCRFCTSYFTNFYNKKIGIDSLKICLPCSKTKHLCQNCILDMQLHIPMDLRTEIFEELGIDKNYSFLKNNMQDIKSEIMKRYINDMNVKNLEKNDNSVKVDYSGVLMNKIDEKLKKIEGNVEAYEKSAGNALSGDFKKPFKLQKQFQISFPDLFKPSSVAETESFVYLLFFNLHRQVAEWEILKYLESAYKINNTNIVTFTCKQVGKIALLKLKNLDSTSLSSIEMGNKFLTLEIPNSTKIFINFLTKSQYTHLSKFLTTSTYQELNNMAKYIDSNMAHVLRIQTGEPTTSEEPAKCKNNKKPKPSRPNKITKPKRVKHGLEL